jgi:SAM-dependent methyltransferase
MQYDSVKRTLSNVFNKNNFLRKFFYILLDLLLLRTWHIKKKLRHIKKIIPKDALILDAGAGFGQYTYFLSRLSKCWKIKAIDIKNEQIEDCNRFFSQIGMSERVKFELSDLNDFNELDKYDLAIIIDVLEHIEDDKAVIHNIFSSLKSNGMLLISTPSDKGGSDTHHQHDDSFIDEHVRNGYSVSDISEMLAQVGFSQIDTQYMYGHAGKISWILSMKFPLIILQISKLFFLILPFYYLITFPLCLLLNIWDVSFKNKTGTGLIVSASKS